MKLRLALMTMFCAMLSLGVMAADKKGGKKPAKAAAGPDLEEIMKQNFKKGTLLDKIKNNQASAEEKTKFAELVKGMIDQTPPKGDHASWEKKTKALYAAAAAVAKGDEKAVAALGEAANCKACHNAHKGG